MRNGKWGNGEMGRWYIAFYSANCWHFASAVIKGKSMSMHTLTERSPLPDSWRQRGVQRHCITYKFITFGSWLAISWVYGLSILHSNFIQGVILKLLHAVACIVMDVCLTLLLKQHVLFKINASIFNRSSLNACCRAYCKTRNGLRNGLIPRTHRKWEYALISCRNDHFTH